MNRAVWEKRIERAAVVGERERCPREVLTFYESILEVQQRVYQDILQSPQLFIKDASFREQLNIETAQRYLPALLALVREKGPRKLADEALALAGSDSAALQQMLSAFLRPGEHGTAPPASFFALTVLQPCAEFLAMQCEKQAGFAGPVCPICGSQPLLAVLRPEGDGGKRYLTCAFCLTEWEFRRMLCPTCNEGDSEKLPRYSADDWPAVRVEGCDTCKHYLKSIDLTVDGLAVPIVDEVATAALDVWAVEHGYRKIQANLMGF